MAISSFASSKNMNGIEVEYEVSEGQVTIKKIYTTLENVAIPSEIDGYPVTTIGNKAFSGCSGLTSITIPDSVTRVTSWMDENAFSSCPNLKEIVVSSSNPNLKSVNGLLLTKDGQTLVAGINGNVTIPDSVTSIGNCAFSYCSGLTSITIPNSVTSIGFCAFSYCSGLTSITIPDGVTRIGGCAFSYCSGLTSIIIPDSVTSIGRFAFSDCSGLTSITIPDGVRSIGDFAFEDCSGLTSITIGNSVTHIWGCAFRGCSGLKEIVVSSSNPNYKSVNGLLLTKDGKTLVVGINGNVTIPDSVTSIWDCAFLGYSGLTSITIPDGVTRIGGAAFGDCSGLTSITIPNSVTSIGDSAFSGCSRLVIIYLDEDSKLTDVDFYEKANLNKDCKIIRTKFQDGRPINDLLP